MKFLTIFFLIFMTSNSPLYAEALKLLVLGDSFAAGYGLSETDGFSKQLERTLQERGRDIEVVNAGLSGDTSLGGLARAPTHFHQDHDAVVLELGANDMLRGMDPALTRSNLERIVELSEKPVFLLGIRAFPSFGQDYVEAFDSIYPTIAEEKGTGFYPFLFETLFKEGVSESWRYFQADRIHPNPEGVLLIVKDLAPSLDAWLQDEGLLKVQLSSEAPK